MHTMINFPSNTGPLQPNELASLANFLGLTVRDGEAYRGPNPFTGEGTDRFALFPEGNGSERNGQLKYTKKEVFEFAQSRGYKGEINASYSTGFLVSGATDRLISKQKQYDIRSLEGRGLSKEAAMFFKISAPMGVNSKWGEYREFPTHQPNGEEVRHRIKYRNPALQPTEDKQGKTRNRAKTLWDPKTKTKERPIAYACHLVEPGDNVYLVNSELAVWLFWQVRVRAICPFGEARSAKSFRAICQCLKDKHTAKLIVLLDADECGQSSTKIVCAAARDIGLDVVAKQWPTDSKRGYDASDFWEDCGKEDRSLRDALADLTDNPLPIEDEAPQSLASVKNPSSPSILTAKELMSTEFPPMRWAVEGLIAAGLTILAGAPKLGKSWMSLDLGVVIATGGFAFGRFPVEAGDVLYLALEDTKRRLQDRLGKVLQEAEAPETLHFADEWPPFDKGGKELLEQWLHAHSKARLIIVDTFKKLRQARGNRSDYYSEDYEHAGEFKTLADKFGVAIILVHHTTKLTMEDPLKSVSGSMGLTGAADSVLVLQRERGSNQAKLFVTGRDIEESVLSFQWSSETCTWTCEGDYQKSAEDSGEKGTKILNILIERFPDGATSTQLQEASGLSRTTFHREIKALVERRLVRKEDGGRGKYRLVEFAAQIPPETEEDRSPMEMFQSHPHIEDGMLEHNSEDESEQEEAF